MKKLLNRLLMSTITRKGRKSFQRLNEMSMQAKKTNEDLLFQIVRDNENTEFGQKHQFSSIHTVDDFQNQVPFTTYDDYAEVIDRSIASGAHDLISAYPTCYYAMTSGSTDNPKKIPVSQKTLDIYEDYSFGIMLAAAERYVKKTKGRSLNYGHILSAIQISKGFASDGTPMGPISMAVMGKTEKILPYFFTTPVPALYCTENYDKKYVMLRFAMEQEGLPCLMTPFMTTLADMMYYMERHHELIVRDIELGRIDDSIRLPEDLRRDLQAYIKPLPQRAKALRNEFSKGFDTPILPRIFPKMDFIGGIGTGSFTIYAEKMRRYSGDIPFYFSVYAASESMMAVAIEMEKGEYVILPHSSFYEFIPVAEPGTQEAEEAEDKNPKTKRLHELEEGHCYEVVITNLAGLYRYRLGDVIRCTGYHHESPKICFVYRKKQMVSIAGEKTDEGCIARVVKHFEEESGESIRDFSIYADTNVSPGRYVLFMEPEKQLPKEKHKEYREIVEKGLAIANPSVGVKVENGTLSPSEVCFLQQETYALYRDLQAARGISENQLKPIRVIDTIVKEKFFFALIDKE